MEQWTMATPGDFKLISVIIGENCGSTFAW